MLITAKFSERPNFNVLTLGINNSGKTAWLDKVRGHVSKTGTRPLQRISPTVGQNVINLTLSSCTLHCWDLGGQESLRSMWTRYLDDAEVLVWAMDANDWLSAADVPPPTAQEKERLPQEYQQDAGAQSEAESSRRRNEAWSVLADLRKNKHIASLPLLIIMTKVDKLAPSQVEHFRLSIRDVMERKLSEFSSDEERMQRDGTNGNADSDGVGSGNVGYWSDWHLIVCSAATGEGVNEFIEWLHVRSKLQKR